MSSLVHGHSDISDISKKWEDVMGEFPRHLRNLRLPFGVLNNNNNNNLEFDTTDLINKCILHRQHVF